MIRGMIRTRLVILLLAALHLTAQCYGQNAPDRAAVDSIIHVLRRAHLSGSLEYCNLPIIKTPTNRPTSPLQTLREMLAGNSDIEVSQDPDRTIRMVERTVPLDLLNVKIEHISFDDEQKKRPNSMYFQTLVLDFITEAPEVRTYMKNHSISFGPQVIKQSMSPNPNFSGELNNVTLAQALDYESKIFRGLWIYEECPGINPAQRTVDFFFYGTE
jgi:hypothetical protein